MFLRETAVPLVAEQHGLIAQYVGVWRDIASIRSFAGENWKAAVIDPSEEHMLQETSISHYATPETD